MPFMASYVWLPDIQDPVLNVLITQSKLLLLEYEARSSRARNFGLRVGLFISRNAEKWYTLSLAIACILNVSPAKPVFSMVGDVVA